MSRALPPELLLDILDAVPFRCRPASATEGGAPVTLWGPDGPRALQGGTSAIAGLEFFPWGGLLTWGSGGAFVRDASGEVLRELVRGEVEGARIFPGAARVATCGVSGECAVWCVRTGSQTAAFTAHRRVGDPRELLPRLHVSVFPSGDRLLVWGREFGATVWNADRGQLLCRLDVGGFVVSFAEIFPDENRVVIGSDMDSRAIVWSVATCAPLLLLPCSDWLKGVAVLAGDRLATLDSDGVATIWSAASGELLHTLARPGADFVQFVYDIVGLPGGHRFATLTPLGATIWNSTGEALYRLMHPGVTGFAASPDGDVLATCGKGYLVAWDSATGARLRSYTDRGAPRVFDGRCLVALGLGKAFDRSGVGPSVSVRSLP